MLDKDVLLSVRDLSVTYRVPRGEVQAVSHVSFQIKRGEFFGLAGESGCGKSTIAYAIMRLLKGEAKITGGEVEFAGQNILAMDKETLRAFRWKKSSMVLQSAMNNLNPVVTIASQLMDAIQAHEKVTAKEALARAEKLLAMVNIPANKLKAYPHELSGGQRQRVVIAMALALKPELVIFDEPTTALDVVVQYNIVRRINELKKEMGFAVLFITHDLPLMLTLCDRISVMYAGKMVESATVSQLMAGGAHPYTQGLLKSFPSLLGEKKRLQGIGGSVPDLITPPSGCLFAPRCGRATPQCLEAVPAFERIEEGHDCACYHPTLSGGDQRED